MCYDSLKWAEIVCVYQCDTLRHDATCQNNWLFNCTVLSRLIFSSKVAATLIVCSKGWLVYVTRTSTIIYATWRGWRCNEDDRSWGEGIARTVSNQSTLPTSPVMFFPRRHRHQHARTFCAVGCTATRRLNWQFCASSLDVTTGTRTVCSIHRLKPTSAANRTLLTVSPRH